MGNTGRTSSFWRTLGWLLLPLLGAVLGAWLICGCGSSRATGIRFAGVDVFGAYTDLDLDGHLARIDQDLDGQGRSIGAALRFDVVYRDLEEQRFRRMLLHAVHGLGASGSPTNTGMEGGPAEAPLAGAEVGVVDPNNDPESPEPLALSAGAVELEGHGWRISLKGAAALGIAGIALVVALFFLWKRYGPKKKRARSKPKKKAGG